MHRKPLITKILLGTIGLMALAPVVHAQSSVSLWGFSFWNLVAELLATLSQWALSITSLFVTITGILLNVSIILTLHIKDFVDNTTGVYLVWETIRDISGMFIIFLLLYASFKLILGLDSGGINSVGNLIKNIVIAGILINFSFFITSLLIDASNIVSMTLYNDIVSAKSTSGYQSISDMVSSATNSSNLDGGMSGIFMNLLMPQNVYSPNTQKLSNVANGISQALTILIQGVVGVVIMITVGLSFFLASIAFVMRFAILIVLLAFSPIWFASMIFPGMVKEYSTKFSEKLQSQLIFMPVYLLLLYAAIRILSTSKIFTNPTTNIMTGSGISTNLIILFINDFFIIFMLNLPLLVALSMSGSLGKLTKKFGADAIWKSVGASAGRRTAGRLAYSLNESRAMGRVASSMPLVGGAVSKGLSNVSSAGFGGKKGGYKADLDQKKKAQDEMHKKVGDSVRREDFAEGKEGDADYLKAKTERQAKYRQNVAWPEWSKSKGLGGKAGSVLGFMLDNRANMESKKKLDEEAGDDDTEAKGKAADVKIKDAKTDIERTEADRDTNIRLENQGHKTKMDGIAQAEADFNEKSKAIEEEKARLNDIIKAEAGNNNLHNIPRDLPSSTAKEEARVVDLQNKSGEINEALRILKEKKMATTKEHDSTLNNLINNADTKIEALNEEIYKQSDISTKGHKVTGKRKDKKIEGQLGKILEEVGKSESKGSGSAPSTPKQPETH